MPFHIAALIVPPNASTPVSLGNVMIRLDDGGYCRVTRWDGGQPRGAACSQAEFDQFNENGDLVPLVPPSVRAGPTRGMVVRAGWVLDLVGPALADCQLERRELPSTGAPTWLLLYSLTSGESALSTLADVVRKNARSQLHLAQTTDAIRLAELAMSLRGHLNPADLGVVAASYDAAGRHSRGDAMIEMGKRSLPAFAAKRAEQERQSLRQLEVPRGPPLRPDASVLRQATR